MNPQHTVPTLKDGDFCMNESRPAAAYIIAKHGKDDKLYPKDVATRAVVDQRLYFDLGTFYKAIGDIMVSNHYSNIKFNMYIQNAKKINPEHFLKNEILDRNKKHILE